MLQARTRSFVALASAVTALAVAPAATHAATATVVRVVDGDTVRLRESGRVRTFDLLGVDAPEASECGGGQATKALRRLLPANGRVKIARDPKGPSGARYISRAGKLVNEALVRAGGARAGTVAGLARASRLTAAQDAARQAGRGLWTSCPAPPQPQPQSQPPTAAPPGTVTGDAAKQRAHTDLQGRVFIRITTTTFSSSESWLHLCSDGSFVEEVSTYSDFGGSTSARYHGRWEVLTADYRAGFASARVRRLNEDGTEGFVDVVAQGNTVTVNGSAVTVRASSVCA